MAASKKKVSEENNRKGIARRLWIAVSTVMVLVTGYFIVRNLTVIVDYRIRISRLEREKAHYQSEITRDSTLIEQLKYDDHLERFARERYRMHRPGEHVFILE